MDTTQTIVSSNGSLTVTTGGDFGLDVGNYGYGIVIDAAGTGDLTFLDENNSSIRAEGRALDISAFNLAGKVEITSTGELTSKYIYGLYLNAGQNVTSSTLNLNAVESANYVGMWVENSGGALSIISRDKIVGGSASGIYNGLRVDNASTATGGVLIDVVRVEGSDTGISISQAGQGTVTIKSPGTIEGRFRDGIAIVTQSGSTGGIDIDVADVTGGTNGIRIDNRGTGAVVVTSTGNVTGTGEAGIEIRNFNGTGIAVSADNTQGRDWGVYAENHSGSGILINSTGIATASIGNGSGIWATNDAADGKITVNANNATGYYGIYAQNAGDGGIDIHTSGTITAYDSGTGQGRVGIKVDNGAGAGDVNVITDGDVTGLYGGVFVHRSGAGNVNITTNGLVSSKSDALEALDDGYGDAIHVEGQDATKAITINANNDVDGFGFGIFVRSTSDVANSTTQGGPGNDVTITTKGLVKGGTDDAIWSETDAGVMSNIHILGTSTVLSDNGIAIGNDDGDSNILIDTGATVTGQILLGAGTDKLEFHGGFSNTTVLNGGGGSVDNADTLSLVAAPEATHDGTQIINWNRFNIVSSHLTLTNGSMTVGGADPATQGVFLTNGSTLQSTATNLALTGNMNLAAGTTLLIKGDGTGANVITGQVTNNGTISLVGGGVGDTLTINGNYIGTNGMIALETKLGDDASPTDMIVINGNATGTTGLDVRNVGGAGARTTGDGIALIDTITSDADAFYLTHAVAIGAYDYGLYQGGLDGGNTDKWFLRSTNGLSPSAQTSSAYSSSLGDYAEATLGTLQQRTGNRIWPGVQANVAVDLPPTRAMAYAPAGPVLYGAGAWGRIGGQYLSVSPKGGGAYTTSLGFLQAGYEGTAYEAVRGQLTLGAYATVGTSRTDVDTTRDPVTGALRAKGKITTKGYGIGANLTWLGNDGFYVDNLAQFTWYDTSLSNLRGSGNNAGWSSALSVEVGQRFDLGSGWSIVPQAQLVWVHADFDSFTDENGSKVSMGRSDSLKGSAGLRLENLQSWKNDTGGTDRLQVYGIAKLSYQFLNGPHVDVGGTTITQQNKRLWSEVGAGGNYAWNDKWSLYGEADFASALSSGSGDNYAVKGTAGLRYRW